MEPNYNKYTLDELYDVEANVDSNRYPERLQNIQSEIKNRGSSTPLVEKSQSIVDIEDAGVHLTLDKVDDDLFEFKLSITYNFLFSYQKTWYKMALNSKDLNTLIHSLKNGIKSWHGNGDLWGANKIFVKKQVAPFQFRDVRLYRRWFIFGFNIVPTTLSNLVLEALYKVEL